MFIWMGNQVWCKKAQQVLVSLPPVGFLGLFLSSFPVSVLSLTELDTNLGFLFIFSTVLSSGFTERVLKESPLPQQHCHKIIDII